MGRETGWLSGPLLHLGPGFTLETAAHPVAHTPHAQHHRALVTTTSPQQSAPSRYGRHSCHDRHGHKRRPVTAQGQRRWPPGTCWGRRGCGSQRCFPPGQGTGLAAAAGGRTRDLLGTAWLWVTAVPPRQVRDWPRCWMHRPQG